MTPSPSLTPSRIGRPLLLALLLAAPIAGCAEPAGPLEPSGDVPEAKGWRAEVVVDGLVHPWAIAWLPDGSALITERPGRLRRLRDGVLAPTPIAGVPEVFAGGQGGLLDLALHPEFARNRLIYLAFAAGTTDANYTALARGRLDGDRLRDVAVIFRNPDTKSGGQHFGSRLLFLPDGSLLMSIGDGGNPPVSFDGADVREQAQNPGTLFGKVVRLRDDGSPHPDNPWQDQAGAQPALHSIGHRNIQGMTLDPDGRVWANEHGSRGGDELNLIRAGNNYGWPAVTYSMEYWGPRISDQTSRPDVTDPLLLWTPSKAPSGLAWYSGDAFPHWRGSLLSGALRAQQIRRIAISGNRITDEEKLSIGQRVRDVRQGPDGQLYVLTDEPDGALLRIVPTSDGG